MASDPAVVHHGAAAIRIYAGPARGNGSPVEFALPQLRHKKASVSLTAHFFENTPRHPI